MSQDGIDYKAFLDDLVRRRDELEAAIAAVSRILGQPVPLPNLQPPPGGVTADNGTTAEVRSDSFFNFSMTDSAVKYLNMVKGPQSATDIANALKRGGFLTQAKNFYANLYTSMKRDARFCKVGKGRWGLAEWYPNRALRKDGTKRGKDGDEIQEEGS